MSRHFLILPTLIQTINNSLENVAAILYAMEYPEIPVSIIFRLIIILTKFLKYFENFYNNH